MGMLSKGGNPPSVSPRVLHYFSTHAHLVVDYTTATYGSITI